MLENLNPPLNVLFQDRHTWQVGSPDFESDAICSHHRVWPWNGHRLFAYDLVRFQQPQRIVELGTYWGTSFFTFCQAVKDAQLATELVAVDTWKGDDHTGLYGSDALSTVEETIEKCFPYVHTRLLKMLFSEAVSKIEDNSVDLLHIDGFHTYEAVKSDYESWLPKLKEQGVVLFHDIADSCGYGSAKFWHELLKQHPGVAFQHSWGLGILFPKGDSLYRQMLRNNLEDKLLIYENTSELNLMRILKEAHEQRGDKQDVLIKHQENIIAELSEKNESLQNAMKNVPRSFLGKLLRRFQRLSGADGA